MARLKAGFLHDLRFALVGIGMCARGASGQVVVDRPPLQAGGPAADTAYVLSGAQRWQQVADDFQLNSFAAIRRVTFWGFYNDDNPPASEGFRIRFYESSSSGDLPGAVAFEQTIADPERMETGLVVFVGIDPDEYRFEVDLPTPFLAEGGIKYWLEIVQLGSIETRFRWEFGPPDNNGHMFMNPSFPAWTSSAPTLASLAVQLSTIPEPATLGLIACGAMLTRRKRRRSRLPHCAT